MKLLLGSILFFTIASFSSDAFAATYTFTGTGASGTNFEDAGNWSPTGGPPGVADTALISIAIPQATALVLPTTTVTALDIQSNTVYINGQGIFNSDFLFVHTGGTLNLNMEVNSQFNTSNTTSSNYIGDATGGGIVNLTGTGTLNLTSSPGHGTCVGIGGSGAVNQSGSTTVNITDNLLIGSDGNFAVPVQIPTGATAAAGGTGTYTLSGSATLNAGYIAIGIGTGLGAGITTGGSTPTSGLLNINAGTVTATTVQLGINGDNAANAVANTTGTVNQISGIATIGTLDVGVATGASANYYLTGGTLTVNNDLNIGGTGANASMTESTTSGASSLIDNGTFEIGTTGGTGSGVFNYYAGTLTTQGISVNAQGTFNLYGTLTPTAISNPIILTSGAFTLKPGGVLTLGGTTNNGGTSGITGTGNLNFAGGDLVVSSTLTDVFNSTISSTSTIDTTAASANLSGNLTGNGTLDIIGGNTVTISGTGNSGSWGATILSGVAATGSTLTITHAGGLSTSGTFTIGTGSTLNLTSTGATDVFGGTISDEIDPNLAAPPATTANFKANITTSLEVAQTNLDTNSATTLTGGGTLTVDNGTISNITSAADSLTIGGTLNSTGTVNLLGAANTLKAVTVNAGATLLAGNIGGTGNVTNNGTLGSLGTINAPSNLMIAGTLTSGNTNPNATLIVHTNGTVGGSDTFTVGGNANLTGTVDVIGVGSQTYTILTAPAVTANTTQPGATLVTNAPTALFSSVVTNTGTSLVLVTTQKPVSTFAQTPNQAAVAGSLDQVITTGVPFSAGFLPVLTKLNSLSASELPSVIEGLSPESLQYARNIAFENSTFLAERMNAVDSDLRDGYEGLDTSAISIVSPGFGSGLGRSLGNLLASNDPAFHQTAPNGVNYYPGESGGSSPSPSSSSASPSWDSSSQVISDTPNPYLADVHPGGPETPNMTEFIGGDVILADLNQNQSTANAPSSKANYTAGDATAGVSFRVTNHFAAGVLFDYNHTDATTDSSGSKTKVNTYSPGVFATYFDHGFYANGLFSFGYNNYTNYRNNAFGTAYSDPNGEQYVGNLDLGYDFHPDKAWVVGPTLGVTYTHLDIDSFTETGAPGDNLSVQDQSADSVRSRLGGHVTFQTNTGDVLLQPSLFAMWQHEYLNSSSGITSSFNDFASTPFTIQTAAPSRDSALIGVGLTATLNNSMALYLDYLADVGADDYWAQSVVGGLKARF